MKLKTNQVLLKPTIENKRICQKNNNLIQNYHYFQMKSLL